MSCRCCVYSYKVTVNLTFGKLYQLNYATGNRADNDDEDDDVASSEVVLPLAVPRTLTQKPVLVEFLKSLLAMQFTMGFVFG